MKTVNFFGHKISKLIIGDNPISGHSYVTDVITGQAMLDYYTTDKILTLLFKMEEYGYTAMLPLADPYMVRVLKEYEASGGGLKYIWQPYMPMNQEVSMRQIEALSGTIGIYHQGTTTDFLFESGRSDEILAQIKQYRQLGIPVGIGTHRPDLIKACEREGWDVDFYMACMYNARRNREGQESGFLSGKSKAGLQFRMGDREIMLNTLKGVEKPVIAFKLFAGGQMLINRSSQEKQELIKDAYNTIFGALKPNDLGAIGVFQRDFDQLKENLELFEQCPVSK